MSKKKTRNIFLATGLAVVLGVGGVAVASAHKTVDIDIDGETQSVSTFAGSVEGALDAAGFEPATHDEVVPHPVDDLIDGDTITVRTAHQVEFDKDGETVELWTVGRTAGDALFDVAGRGDIELAVSRSNDGRPELNLPLVEDGAAKFEVDGEEIEETFSGSVDLHEALEEIEIELGKRDKAVVTATDDGTPLVTITRISVKEKTSTKKIEFESETRKNDDKYKDEKTVVQQGKDGERTIVTEVTKVDGKETKRKELSDEVTTKPVTHIVEVGTKSRPAPTPPKENKSSNNGNSGNSGGGGGGSAPDGVWGKLAQCESGGNPSIVSASGTYHGLYQFSVATWQSVGGSGLPSQASAGEQTKRAKMLQERSGWGQWPACAAQLGLL